MKNIQYTILSVCLVLFSGNVFSQNESYLPDNPPAPLTITATHDSICPGELTTLTANLIGGGTYTWSPGGATSSSITVSPPSTQAYTVVAVQGANHYRDSLTITFVPLQLPMIISSKDSVCYGDTLTLFGIHGLTYKWSPGGETTATIHITLDSSTTYKLYAYNSLGCADSTTLRVLLIQSIGAVIRAVPDSICIFDTATLTIAAIGGQGMYKWSTGATTSTIFVSPSIPTTYTASVYGICDSIKESITVAIKLCTGINEISNANRFRVFPNPSNGIFTIGSETEVDKSCVEIYNVLGEKVYSQFSTFNSPLLINISNQPSGIYFYRVLEEDGSLTGEGKLMLY